MGWYIRKSVRMGPVRWNLSRSGIGVSVGVRGLRVGSGPRGAYVAGGRGGLYFRKSLNGGRNVPKASRIGIPRSPAVPIPHPALSPQPGFPSQVAPVEYLPETQINSYQPATADDLAQYIAAQRRHVALFPWVLGIAIVLNLLVLGNLWPLAILTLPAAIAGCIYIYRLDRQRTHVALNYDLDPAEAHSYQQLCTGLQVLASAARIQRVEARQVHGDWKHQAGTTSALQLAPVAVLPPGSIPWLETNVPVWAVRWKQGHLTLLFLPDRLLVEQGRQVATVRYDEMQTQVALARFVETGMVPRDARVVGYNWQYPNKDGGPDRRFRTNRQWPVLEVAYLALYSSSGLNLALQVSNRQSVDTAAHSIRSFRPLMVAALPVIQ